MAVSAQSVAAVEDVADLLELRALVTLAGRGPLSLGELATAADLHLTRASRLCDRLVGKGLIDRADDPANRRQLVLSLTDDGQRLVQAVAARRRAAIDPILARLSKQRRADLVAVLTDFAAAAGEPADRQLWSFGWLSDQVSVQQGAQR